MSAAPVELRKLSQHTPGRAGPPGRLLQPGGDARPCRRSGAGASRSLRGFTLIELLAAVTVLLIIATMLGVIFAESDRAWTLGTNRADLNLAARAALNMLAHDVQYAVADTQITFRSRLDRDPTKTVFGLRPDEINVVSLQNDSQDGRRTAREVFYYVRENPSGSRRYELMRGYFDQQLTEQPAEYLRHCYYNTNWYESTGNTTVRRPDGSTTSVANPARPTYPAVVCHNIAAFRVFTDAIVAGRTGVTNDYSSGLAVYGGRLPRYLDVSLELLTDKDARQAADLMLRGSTNYIGFVRKNAVRYATRVYFHNRDGYKRRD